jgi:hypothetical protein
MNTFFNSLSENPFLMIILIIAGGILIVIAFIQGREISFWPPKIGPQDPGVKKVVPRASQGIMIYPNSDNNEFSVHFERLFRQAEKIVLIGIGFSILHRQTLGRLLINRIRNNSSIEIYAANPFSPNVQMRLIEEETGEDTPEIRKRGLVNWLISLLAEKERLTDKSRFILRVFPFYPTYALFIFDMKDYFFYPYGYTKLGTLSPVLHFSKDEPTHQVMVQFLDAQSEQVKEQSADANLIFNIHNGKDVERSLLIPFAIYLIPSADTSLYKLGSEILEYDVRANKELQITKWHNVIGAAFDYGLHITVADALYCVTKSDINLICKEVEFLANEFQPFALTLSLEKDFPNERGIALVSQDKSGSLEALHHEMVAHVYRKAVASNYNFDPSLANRDSDGDRARLMIKHYHAPYILQRYKPHFSLLSNVHPERKEQIYTEIKRLYEKRIKEPFIEIDYIAVMYRPDPKGHWQILKEYKLGGDS